MNTLVPVLESLLLGVPTLLLLTRDLPDARRDELRRLVFIGFALRLAVACMFDLVPETRVFHEDTAGYEDGAMGLASAWLGEAPPVPFASLGKANESGYPGFLVFCTSLYYVFGRFRLVVTAMTSLFGSVTIIYVYRLAARSFQHRVAMRAVTLCTYFPSMVLWSAMALKDPLMIMLIVIALDSALQLRDHLNVGAIVRLGAIFLAIWFVRYYIVYFVALAVLVSLLVSRGRSAVGAFYRQLAVVIVLAAFSSAVGLTKNISSSLDSADLAHISVYRQGMAATANSGFYQDVDVSTTGGAIAFLPIGMSVLLLGPFPWQMTSFRALVTLPEMLIWWMMVPDVWRGVRFALRKRFGNMVPIFIFAVTLITIYSLTLGNVGAAFRQRAQVFVFLFVFAAVGHWAALCKKKGVDEDAILEPA